MSINLEQMKTCL